MYEPQMRWPAMVVRRMKPTLNRISVVMPMTRMMTPKTTTRAATIAGRTALSLTAATTVSMVSSARAERASPMSFSATGERLPAAPATMSWDDVADADGIGAGVGADHGPELGGNQGVLGGDALEGLPDLGEVAAGAVGHGDALERRVGLDLVAHVGQGP